MRDCRVLRAFLENPWLSLEHPRSIPKGPGPALEHLKVLPEHPWLSPENPRTGSLENMEHFRNIPGASQGVLENSWSISGPSRGPWIITGCCWRIAISLEPPRNIPLAFP